MKWFKRLGAVVLFAVLAGLLVLGLYVWRSFPQLDGTLRVQGLQGAVTVERDASDVTHIKAATARDAWFTLGFVHAQERGWQLEFNRRVMRGTLSEVLGEATLETDKLLRTLGIMQAAQRQLDRMPPEARAALEAYSEGIQSFYANRPQALQPEFLLLGVRPGRGGKAWEAVDSVGWSLMMALDLGGNWGTEFARLSAAQVVDTPRLWELFPPYPGEPPASTVDFAALYRQLGIYRSAPEPGAKTSLAPRETPVLGRLLDDAARSWSAAFVRDAGLSEGKGSNAWVVSGGNTASGKPLLANDPHLGLSAPAIWYFARLQAPTLDVMGATLPGLPFVVLGRTRTAAWGFTNTGPDVQDLYIEQIKPDDPMSYRVDDVQGQAAWARFDQRVETIRVKGKPDVQHTVRSTRHGPVLSDAQSAHARLIDMKRYVLSLRWAALEADNNTALAMQRVDEARDVGELLTAFSGYHSPMQNVMMADTAGRIAYKAVGRVPLRRPDNDIRGIAPSPGWDPRYAWVGWLAYADTPGQGEGQGEQPAWIANANQRVTPPGYPYFIGQDWSVPYRFDRIVARLAATPRHDAQSMARLQGDTVSLATQRLLPFLRKAQSSHPLAPAAQRVLQGFDADMRGDSAAALVFSVWVDELTRGLLVPRLGQERFDALYGKRHFRSTVEIALEADDAWWCAPRGCADQAGQALTRTLERLSQQYGDDLSRWRWDTPHIALSSHRPFGNVDLLARWFDVRVPTGGDTFSVNVGQYWPNDTKVPFASRHAASLRAIYDLSDLERSQFIYQTGQSGLVFSSRYRDMSQEWSHTEYRFLRMAPESIAHTLQLVP
ncbi:penicillin acylase family protein [Pseudorhodoferax sp. Leaf274]|uniref:penicillin acylase family protein n=1 Tax=Pseudorhodoferax sp. Leaf274 TaxID=1736318 RepID=UPI000702F0F0|nr:penicillin acylase family protein [Pseudorhodoferax sp. Leaf274]KQP38898.1 penicillin amidase [Pseudorhodoferax sp. Leaf274]